MLGLSIALGTIIGAIAGILTPLPKREEPKPDISKWNIK